MRGQPSRPAGGDPDRILSREEIRVTVDEAVRRGLAAQLRLFREAESAIGCVALGLALWLAIAGWYAIRGEWR